MPRSARLPMLDFADPEQPTTNKTRPRENSIVGLVAGPFADDISQIWSGPRIGEYLSATDARRHVWHSWLASTKQLFDAHNSMAGDLAYARLTYARGKDLIEQAYGRYPHGAMRALSLLGPTARPKEVYLALAQALLQGNGGAKFVRHCSELSNEMVRAIAALPGGMGKKSVLNLIARRKLGYQEITFFSWAIKRLEDLGMGKSVSSVCQADEPYKALWEAIRDLPFPAAPFAGNERLRPVTSHDELRSLATRFNNCFLHNSVVQEAALAVLNAERYYYEWRGDQPALLDFRRLVPLGWYLKEARGQNNTPLTDSTREQIFMTFSGRSDICAAWNDDQRLDWLEFHVDWN